MRYLAILAILATMTVGCTKNEVNDEIGIEKDEVYIPPNGIDHQGIEKDEYYIPPNG